MDVGLAFANVDQDGLVGAAMDTSSERGLQRGVADHAQSHAGHGRTRSAASFGRSRAIDDACLCGERNGRKTDCGAPRARWVNGVLANVKRATSGHYPTVKRGNDARRHSVAASYHFDRWFYLAAMLQRLIYAAMFCDPWPEPSLGVVGSFHG